MNEMHYRIIYADGKRAWRWPALLLIVRASVVIGRNFPHRLPVAVLED